MLPIGLRQPHEEVFPFGYVDPAVQAPSEGLQDARAQVLLEAPETESALLRREVRSEVGRLTKAHAGLDKIGEPQSQRRTSRERHVPPICAAPVASAQDHFFRFGVPC